MGARYHRRHQRWPVLELQASIVTASNNKPVDFIAVDVSEQGIGVLSRTNILPEANVVLLIGDARVLLRTAFCQPSNHPMAHWRYGFKCIDPSISLVHMCRIYGSLDTKQPLISDEAEVLETL